MKEYLVKLSDGSYFYTNNASCYKSDDVVEIPNGAKDLTIDATGTLTFWDNNGYSMNVNEDMHWMKPNDDILSRLEYDQLVGNKVVWSRSETEYLMQGKNGERLMESVGQLNSGKIVSDFVVDGEEKHSHYRKSVKHLDFIDPYRIAQLYGLHPCADHIAKKALCTGKRGHKDLMRDIQDIIDTAERWKQMIQEDQNAI